MCINTTYCVFCGKPTQGYLPAVVRAIITTSWHGPGPTDFRVAAINVDTCKDCMWIIEKLNQHFKNDVKRIDDETRAARKLQKERTACQKRKR